MINAGDCPRNLGLIASSCRVLQALCQLPHTWSYKHKLYSLLSGLHDLNTQRIALMFATIQRILRDADTWPIWVLEANEFEDNPANYCAFSFLRR
jgi:hypothetical protein